MNLSEWANLQGVQPQSAYRWFREGTLPVPARKIGRETLVGDLETSSSMAGMTALYACVSSVDQRADLDRLVARVSTWETVRGRVVAEVGSGLNGNRRKFRALLADPNDLVCDRTEVLTSCCARLYGTRAAHRTVMALAAAQEVTDAA